MADQFAAVDVSDVRVVVRAETAEAFAAAAPASRVIAIDDASGAFGSATSLLRALDRIQAADEPTANVLMLDGDLVFEQAFLDAVASAAATAARPTLFVVESVNGDPEEVRVYADDDGMPCLLGKDVPSRLADGCTLLGESAGVVFIPASEIDRVRQTIRWASGETAGRRPLRLVEHEDVWQALMALRRMDAVVIDRHVGRPVIFAECDDAADYRHILDEIWPAVLRIDGER